MKIEILAAVFIIAGVLVFCDVRTRHRQLRESFAEHMAKRKADQASPKDLAAPDAE